MFIIVLLTTFIIFIEPYLILILFLTIFILWILLSKTYAESKSLGLALGELNNSYIKFIDKLLNDKFQFMLSLNNKNEYIHENQTVKKIHLNQFLTQKNHLTLNL